MQPDINTSMARSPPVKRHKSLGGAAAGSVHSTVAVDEPTAAAGRERTPNLVFLVNAGMCGYLAGEH